jgi:cell filamentation protein
MSRLNNDLLNYESKYTKNGVLANKFDCTNEEDLSKMERMITSRKLAMLYLNPGNQTFDVSHYLDIHKFLFEDVYDFAGQIRNENINKRIPFCMPQYIFNNLNDTLKRANQQIKTITDREQLLVFITQLYSDLDIIHPFREGNGRCEREFIRQFIDHICSMNHIGPYYLNYEAIQNREAYIDAVVKADIAFDYTDLLHIFDSILIEKEDQKEKEI